MRILSIHNRYLQPGGEDSVVQAERKLLTQHGHEVITYDESNQRIAQLGNLRTAIRTVWSQESYGHVLQLIRQQNPDVISVHNFFPLISPSLYYAAARHNVPVLQTLHNYRLLCPGAYLLRNNTICEDCVGKLFPIKGIQHCCYRNSLRGSIAVGCLIGFHKLIRTWQSKVARYVVLTEFAKQKFVTGGLPEKKIEVKPNFIELDPGEGGHNSNSVLFVGRLSEEKGILPLVQAWKKQKIQNKLLIAGTGPLHSRITALVCGCENVVLLGQLPMNQVYRKMKDASCLVFPSLWYEGMPRTIIEAFACGLPVVASRLGGIEEMITDDVSGLLAEPNADDLIAKLNQVLSDAVLRRKLSRGARLAYENKYTAETNYRLMIDIYSGALESTARHCIPE